MNSEIKVYEKKPEDFFPKVEVAATYVSLNGKLLLLELAPKKQEAGAWGVPAGKLEVDEMPVKGAQRELFEETGIDKDIEDFQSLGALYIRKPDLDYTYHLFSLNLNTQYPVCLSPEHSSYKWVSPAEARNLPLMNGANQALDVYYDRHED
ncbi:MAG: NUDIX hydrolase [Parachlamydia sp.]|nr:MAG: NUDIX hydrolase [Parachlamydia sp.]